MSDLIAADPWAWLGLTVVLLGFCAFMTGDALGRSWAPRWQVFFYCVLMAFACRFLLFALFGATLLSPTGIVCDAVTLTTIGLASFKLSRAAKMVSQYPWLYRRTGPFSWTERAATEQRTS